MKHQRPLLFLFLMALAGCSQESQPPADLSAGCTNEEATPQTPVQEKALSQTKAQMADICARPNHFCQYEIEESGEGEVLVNVDVLDLGGPANICLHTSESSRQYVYDKDGKFLPEDSYRI